MLRRHQYFYYQALQVIDALLLVGALFVAYFMRVEVAVLQGYGPSFSPLDNYLWLIGLILPGGPLLLELQGFYRADLAEDFQVVLGRVVRAVLYLWLILFGVIFFLRIPNETLSRGMVILYLPLGVLAVVGRSAAFRWWYRRKGLSARLRKSVMLCGSPAQFARWREKIGAESNQQFEIRAEVELKPGFDREFMTHLHAEHIELVIFELDQALFDEINQGIKSCEDEGVEAWVTADFITTSIVRPRFDEYLGRPLLVFRTTPDISWQLLIKNMIDRLGATFVLLLLLPVLIAVAFAIRVVDGAPVFFSQMRSGRHGKPFRMYKFRTMVTGAELKKAELMARNEMTGPVFKLENDPRITRTGRWLRKFSLDEFPQLWNVLLGDMSLVGPRPLPIQETAGFTDFTHRRRLSVRPGLTCLWQIAGRNKITDFGDWVRLDLEYIDRWSLLLDLRILLKTIPVVLFGKGAK